MKTSGVLAPPTMRNSGRTRNRPPNRMATIAATPRATSSHGMWFGTLSSASNGTSATSGMKAMSWNRRTAKLSRPTRGRAQIPFAQHRQHDRGRRQGQAGAEDDRAGPGHARDMGQRRQYERGRDRLAQPETDHRFAQRPQPFWAELQSDQEQEHDHAELRDMGDLLDVGHQPEGGRTDDDAGDEITENAAEAQPTRDRHGHRRGGQQHDERFEHATSEPRGAPCPPGSDHDMRRSESHKVKRGHSP